MSQIPTQKLLIWHPIFDLVQKFGSILLVAAIAAGGYYAAHYLLPGSGHAAAESDHVSTEASPEPKNFVVLTPEKLNAAKLTTSKVVTGEFQRHKKVPGKISFDASKKVDLRASVSSVVAEVLVQRGQSVKAGDQLLVLESPEIGQARIAIERAKAQVEFAEKENGWANETNQNLNELLAVLNQQPTVEQVNSTFDAKTLGEHRDEILSVYSQLLLAKKSLERSTSVDTAGVIPGRVLDERRSSMEVADAKYKGVVEESKFQSAQDFSKAKSKLEAAVSELEICRENLNSLIGPYGDPAVKTPGRHDRNLGRFVLKAPRDGQVIELAASNSARFAAGEVLTVIAQTSDVWVEAQISQRDMTLVRIKAGDTISVAVPGETEQTYPANVRFFNASVSPTTLAIPLVAELDNAEQVFCPGMFVWVSVPIGDLNQAITVPIGAIQRDGEDIFVFRAEGGQRFRRLEVKVASESEGRAEVTTGLNEGDEVVDSGAFYLKSELLLEAD